MARFRVYIRTFDIHGNYEEDFQEITEDVISLSAISQALDSSEYDVGVFRNSSFKIKLRNDHGRYSDPSTITSVFTYKRTETQVRVTWDASDYDLFPGFFYPGQEILNQEFEVFHGLLEDVSGSSNIHDQIIEFIVLGFESLLSKSEVPFSEFSNGDLVSELFYQSIAGNKIAQLVTVDQENIVLGQDVEIDDVTDLENQTVDEALKAGLMPTGSVLYLRNGTLYIKNRDASEEDKYAFYGQASEQGTENIINIQKYRDGLNRVFNYWTWEDTTFLSKNQSSIDKYGIRKKEINYDLISIESSEKIESLLEYNKNEFSEPKSEFELTTPITYQTIDLYLLDKVSIDYPTIYIPSDDKPLPRYGTAIYGDARYPYELWPVVINRDDRFKIISRKIDTSLHTITFGLRKV